MITYPNLYHLKYFCDAVTLGSISAAAQKNLVTHPAISRAIKSLENHLDTPLLEHRKKAFKVTKAGLEVAKQAQVLLSAASDFGSLNLNSQNVAAVILKIGISRTLSEVYLNPLLQEIKMNFPLAKIQVRFGTTQEIVQAVASGTIDLGLTIGKQNLPTLKQDAIKKGQFILVESSKGSPANKKIETKLFILTEPRYETEKLRSGYIKQFGQSLPTLFEISSWEVIGKQVQNGFGVGLLPDILIKQWKADSFRIIKMPWFDCKYEIYIHSLKARPHNQVLELAYKFLSERPSKG